MLKTKKMGRYWWILGHIDEGEEYGPVGPYNSKEDAREGKMGLEEYEKHKDDPGFVTNENCSLRS